MPVSKKAIIIGAGPAGLTAAYELLHRTDIIPVIIEKSGDVGGLSKTVNYKGNRIDIGGHRFFSKSDRVMKWWLNILQLEKQAGDKIKLNYQNQEKELPLSKVNQTDSREEKVMLVRERFSRIYYLKKFFTYPVTLSWDTISKLGIFKTAGIGVSYLQAKIFPRREEHSLEDFFINRFGKNLYFTFFKDYTEKVWGTSCKQIPAEWGAQRIKELSVTKAIWHSLKKGFQNIFGTSNNLAQKNTTTSLIQHFLYPKYGPGQLWEEVARIIIEKGGSILYNRDVVEIATRDQKVSVVKAANNNGEMEAFTGEYFFSTMPVKNFIEGLSGPVPEDVLKTATGLQYRDFITVGLLVRKMITGEDEKPLKDNWIYIQEKEVMIGRLQIFNNWSPYLVSDPGTTWLGLEYFCNKGEAIWNMNDDELANFAIDELVKINLVHKDDVLDHTVIRMEKTYPAYFGTYANFDVIRDYVNKFENLFFIGRNGMHKYNNADHSMLTAMTAVDNIVNGISSKENIWSINTEQDYQESN